VETSSFAPRGQSCQEFYSTMDSQGPALGTQNLSGLVPGSVSFFKGQTSPFLRVRLLGITKNLQLSALQFNMYRLTDESRLQLWALQVACMAGFALYFLANVLAKQALWKFCVGVSGFLLFLPVDSPTVFEQLKFPALMMLLLCKEVRPLFTLLAVAAMLVARIVNPHYGLVVLGVLVPLHFRCWNNMLFLGTYFLLLGGLAGVARYLVAPWLAQSAAMERILLGLQLLCKDQEGFTLLESTEASEDELASVI
jgi:hypothetical protein